MNGINGMNKNIAPITISKEAISQMEQVLFPGRIIVVQTPEEARKAVSYLSKFSMQI